jgi:fumarate reductase flavoprotein subunit
MIAVESPTQKRLGIKSSRDQVFKETMEFARWSVNPKVVRAYVDKSGEIIGWLEGKGLKFEVTALGPGPALGHGFSVRQGGHAGKDPTIGPGFVGSTVVEAMLKDCEKLGIKVLTKTKANKVLTDAKGRISGVLASAKDKEFKISTKSVIIAAGGFGGNKEWLEKYFHIHGDICRNSLGHLTGDGLAMAAELGAFDDSNLGIIIFGPCHHPWAHSVHFAMTRPDMLWVNKNGERFMDESSHGGIAAGEIAAMNRQPGQILYALVDSKTIRDIKEAPPERSAPGSEHAFDTLYEDLDKEAAEGKKIWKANTLDELAKLIGMKPEVLKASVERYNSFCDKGYDADFVKDKQFLKPLRTPPYYAILGRRGYDTTHGGINVNERMEALNKQGKVISGLYAAGDNAGDWVSPSYYPPGTSLTWCFCSGYIAGENAAKYVSGNN